MKPQGDRGGREGGKKGSFYLWVVVKVQASHPDPWSGGGGALLKMGGTWLVTAKQGWMSVYSAFTKAGREGRSSFPWCFTGIGYYCQKGIVRLLLF